MPWAQTSTRIQWFMFFLTLGCDILLWTLVFSSRSHPYFAQFFNPIIIYPIFYCLSLVLIIPGILELAPTNSKKNRDEKTYVRIRENVPHPPSNSQTPIATRNQKKGAPREGDSALTKLLGIFQFLRFSNISHNAATSRCCDSAELKVPASTLHWFVG